MTEINEATLVNLIENVAVATAVSKENSSKLDILANELKETRVEVKGLTKDVNQAKGGLWIGRSILLTIGGVFAWFGFDQVANWFQHFGAN